MSQLLVEELIHHAETNAPPQELQSGAQRLFGITKKSGNLNEKAIGLEKHFISYSLQLDRYFQIAKFDLARFDSDKLIEFTKECLELIDMHSDSSLLFFSCTLFGGLKRHCIKLDINKCLDFSSIDYILMHYIIGAFSDEWSETDLENYLKQFELYKTLKTREDISYKAWQPKEEWMLCDKISTRKEKDKLKASRMERLAKLEKLRFIKTEDLYLIMKDLKPDLRILDLDNLLLCAKKFTESIFWLKEHNLEFFLQRIFLELEERSSDLTGDQWFSFLRLNCRIRIFIIDRFLTKLEDVHLKSLLNDYYMSVDLQFGINGLLKTRAQEREKREAEHMAQLARAKREPLISILRKLPWNQYLSLALFVTLGIVGFAFFMVGIGSALGIPIVVTITGTLFSFLPWSPALTAIISGYLVYLMTALAAAITYRNTPKDATIDSPEPRVNAKKSYCSTACFLKLFNCRPEPSNTKIETEAAAVSRASLGSSREMPSVVSRQTPLQAPQHQTDDSRESHAVFKL